MFNATLADRNPASTQSAEPNPEVKHVLWARSGVEGAVDTMFSLDFVTMLQDRP
jgi:hypothetical protein